MEVRQILQDNAQSVIVYTERVRGIDQPLQGVVPIMVTTANTVGGLLPRWLGGDLLYISKAVASLFEACLRRCPYPRFRPGILLSAIPRALSTSCEAVSRTLGLNDGIIARGTSYDAAIKSQTIHRLIFNY